MNTQNMPALARSLTGSLPQQAVRQLMQALGNCNQDVNQRGGMNVQPTYRLQNGVVGDGTWNPSQYPGLIPNAGEFSDNIINIPGVPGYTNSPWNSVFYGGNQFSFPTSQEFAVNNFYGGASTKLGGNIEMDFVSVTRFQRRGGRRDDDLDALGRPVQQSVSNVFNTFENNIPVPELEPPLVLDPIQYVTGVSVFLSKSRKGITLPQKFAAPLTADDFETSDIPTDLSVGGSQKITIPPIPDEGSLESVTIIPGDPVSINTGYTLAGSLNATDTVPTGLSQSDDPITLTAKNMVSVMRADATVSGTANGTGSLSITKATGLQLSDPFDVNNVITITPTDSSPAITSATVTGSATGSGNVTLGNTLTQMSIGDQTVDLNLGKRTIVLDIPTGFDPETCTITNSNKSFEIDLGNVPVTFNFGTVSASMDLGTKSVTVSVPAQGLTVEATETVSVPTSFKSSIDLSKISITTSDETVDLNVSVPAAGLTVGSTQGDASVPTAFNASIDLSKISISTQENSSALDISNLSLQPSGSVSLPASYTAESGVVTLSGGNSTELTIDGSSFSVESGGSQAVFSGIKPDDELSQPEMAEEFFVLEDAAVTTSVSTEFALTTPFGGQ